MVYFLGRDVLASITTEHDFCGISVSVEQGEAYANNVRLAEVASINASTDIITTSAAHGLTSGDPIQFTMDGTDASVGMTNIDAHTIYFANVASSTTFSVHATHATGVSGASKIDISDSEATTTNVTRELNGTSDNSSPDTFIFNRSYPKYLDDGGMQDITDSSTSAAPLNSTSSNKNMISDLVGIELSLGKTDEDIAFFGQRTGLKAEIKNEVTLTLTRKKSDARFELLFNKARDGLMTYTDSDLDTADVDAATAVAANVLPAVGTVKLNQGGPDGTKVQPNQNFGYRLHLQLKASTEVMSLKNMCMTEYAVSLNPDGVTEETITFYGFLEPKIATSANSTLTTAAEL
jgi:hypothetical protein